MKSYTTLLTIAGSDSGGGAGIQADLKTSSALGCFAVSVVTALTAQNTCGVSSVFSVPPQVVVAQLEAVFSDIAVDGVKIGMLYNVETIRQVTHILRAFPKIPLVIDPVMHSKNGCSLLQPEALSALKELMSQASLATPNLAEASLLLNREIAHVEELPQAAYDLMTLCTCPILLKGGHLPQPGADCLCVGLREVQWFTQPPLTTKNTHGTGCTLSTAITAFLAKKRELSQAIEEAQKFVQGALRAGSEYTFGKGHGPLHHFYAWWGL